MSHQPASAPEEAREHTFALNVAADFEEYRREISLPDSTISLILPGYFALNKLPQHLQEKLEYAWVTHLIQQAINLAVSIKFTDIAFDMAKGNIYSALILPILTTALSKFKEYKLRDTFKLDSIEKYLAGNLATDTLRSLEILPELTGSVINDTSTIPIFIREIITGQFNAGNLELMRASRLLAKGWSGRLMFAIFIVRFAGIFITEFKKSPFMDKGLLEFVTSINEWTNNFTQTIFPEGQSEYYLNKIRDNLNYCLDSFEEIRPGFLSWLPTLPLEGILFGIAELLSIQSICDSKTPAKLQLISGTMIECSFSCRATDHMKRAVKAMKTMSQFQKLTELIRYINEKHPYEVVPADYFSRPPSISLSNLTQYFTSPASPLYHNQSVNLEAGRIWLEGENGTGKSVLLSLIAGRQRPKLGSANICGMNIRRISPENRDHVVTHIPQMFSKDLSKPVIFHILLWLGNTLFTTQSLNDIDSYRTANEILDEHRDSTLFKNLFTIAATLGVEELMQRDSAVGLSDGQKKLLTMLTVVMRATYIESMKIILLDEPAAGVSTGNTKTIKDSLTMPCFADKIVIVTTHNPRIFEINPIPYSSHFVIEDREIREIAMNGP